MYTLMDAHPVTLIVVFSAMLVVPFYLFATYVFSGASAVKGVILASLFTAWGAVMVWFCLAQVQDDLELFGRFVVAICWLTPTVLLVVFRKWALSVPLSQPWLVGLQVWRVIGGVFLIEFGRGNLPGLFAFPVGIGDIIAGLLALGVLLAFRKAEHIPRWAIVAVLVVGIADFLGAFFFGTTTSSGPLQLFTHDARHTPLVFPVGLIPFFLVPYAIFFHALSWLSLRREGQ